MATPDAKGTSRADILVAARSLINASGVEQLSMRKLAADLGVAVTAIYWHIGNKEELLDAVIDDWLADMAPIEPSGTDAKARIASIVRTARNQAHAHPELVALAHDRDRDSTMAQPVQVALARELSAAGITGPAGASALRSLLLFAAGHVLAEVQAETVRQAGARQRPEWQGIDGVDAGLALAMEEPADFDALFDQGLDALLHATLD